MSVLVNIYRKVLPESLRYKILRWRTAGRLNRLKTRILEYYKKNPSGDSELNEALVFLRKNPLTVFPYEFSKKYNPQNIQVLRDDSTGLSYVMHGSHKLYFKKGLTPEQIRHMYSFLLCEQDPGSPHCYLDKDFSLGKNAVLADVGCAEGIFSLMNIEKVKEVVLFEADSDWIEALEQTFQPWKEKVTLVNKFVSDASLNKFISLDDYFRTKKIDFLKIDVDGAEDELLKGAQELITKSKLQIALCTYHKQGDAEKFNMFLQKFNYKTSFSKNYMLFYFDDHFEPPYFRKALLRASN